MLAYLKGLFAPSGRVALLGLGFLQSWMYVVSQRLIFDSVDFQLVFHLGMAAALFVVAFIGHRSACVGLVFPDYRAGCVCDVMAAVGMALLPFVAIVSLIFAPMVPSLGALLEPVAFGILAGSSLGWCFARWFALYCLLPARDGMCYLLAAFALGALGCLAFCLMGVLFPVVPLVCALLLPVGSAVALHRAHVVIEGDSDSDLADDEIDGGSVTTGQRRLSRLSTEILPAADQARQLRPARRKTAPLIVQVVIYALVFGNGIVFGVLQGDGLPSTGLFAANILNYALRAILPALLMLWLAAQSADGTTNLRASLNAVLLALAFALLSLWFIGGFEGIVAYAAVAAARNLVLVLLYAALVKLAHVSRVDPYVVFGLGRAAYEVSLSLGVVIYGAIGPGASLAGRDLIYVTALCVFIFLIGCFFATAQGLDEADIAAVEDLTDGNGPQGQVAPADPRAWLRSAYGLSEREYQIVCLFCQGRSKRAIAQVVGLSENTVRWYLQQAYARMGVHSRDELLVLVDGADRGDGSRASICTTSWR